MSKCYLKMKAHLFPILTLRELTNRQKYLQNRQMLSGRKEQHILFMDKNNGSETLHASMCFGNKNAESFWDQDIPAGGSYTGFRVMTTPAAWVEAWRGIPSSALAVSMSFFTCSSAS